MNIYEKLVSLKDEKYRDFQSKLIPNIDKEDIIGVRTPDMKKVAKELFLSKDKEEFLSNLPHQYMEENLIHIFVVSMIKDFDTCVSELNRFLPYVNCWPVCDQSSPKVFKHNHQRLLPITKEWISSKHVYISRYGMRILMNEFLDDDFKAEYLDLVANKKSDDYYLKMMQAWYFATALAKQYDATIPYFENHRLDPWVNNKAIQKAIESYRVSEEHKSYLRKFKVELK